MNAQISMDREFDIVIFGSTAFTGRLAVQYFAQCKTLPPGFKWAIAGRNAEKLVKVFESVKDSLHPPQTTFSLDHSDIQAVDQLVSKTKIVLSYAGPFGRYGENIVSACARLGTHYLDITGEVLWIEQMIQKHESTAQKSGAILIPFSGFDSIPSDIGSWYTEQIAQERGLELTRVIHVLSVRGGFNGGTFQTALDFMDLNPEEEKKSHDPFLLVPQDQKEQFHFSELKYPVNLPELEKTFPPFMMENINSRIVYRSQALRKTTHPFEYLELGFLPGPFSKLSAWSMVLGMKLFFNAGKIKKVRSLYEKLGPKSGEGPSDKIRESGFFRSQFFAYSDDTFLFSWDMRFNGDPGNKATVMLSCEAALALNELLHGETPPPGFTTPSVALGVSLFSRLKAAGMKIRVDSSIHEVCSPSM